MKTLYLLRHADASRDSDNDFSRTLTEKGLAEVKALGNALKEQKFCCELVICSPAVRTKQTWKTLSKYCECNKVSYIDTMYNPEFMGFIECVRNIDNNFSSVLIISHNPSISDFANYIVDNKHPLSFGTTDLACFSLDITAWSDVKKRCANLEWLSPTKEWNSLI